MRGTGRRGKRATGQVHVLPNKLPAVHSKVFLPPAVGWENPKPVLGKREHVLFDLTEISDVPPWVKSKLSKKAKNLAFRMKEEIKELRERYSNSERTANEYKR